jgi:hypothetical protein
VPVPWWRWRGARRVWWGELCAVRPTSPSAQIWDGASGQCTQTLQNAHAGLVSAILPYGVRRAAMRPSGLLRGRAGSARSGARAALRAVAGVAAMGGSPLVAQPLAGASCGAEQQHPHGRRGRLHARVGAGRAAHAGRRGAAGACGLVLWRRRGWRPAGRRRRRRRRARRAIPTGAAEAGCTHTDTRWAPQMAAAGTARAPAAGSIGPGPLVTRPRPRSPHTHHLLTF